jgi:hypothetical protein
MKTQQKLHTASVQTTLLIGNYLSHLCLSSSSMYMCFSSLQDRDNKGSNRKTHIFHLSLSSSLPLFNTTNELFARLSLASIQV